MKKSLIAGSMLAFTLFGCQRLTEDEAGQLLVKLRPFPEPVKQAISYNDYDTGLQLERAGLVNSKLITVTPENLYKPNQHVISFTDECNKYLFKPTKKEMDDQEQPVKLADVTFDKVLSIRIDTSTVGKEKDARVFAFVSYTVKYINRTPFAPMYRHYLKDGEIREVAFLKDKGEDWKIWKSSERIMKDKDEHMELGH